MPPAFPYGDVYEIVHITKSPLTGERAHWLAHGEVVGENAPNLWVQRDRFSLIAAAGYDVREWYNAPDNVQVQLWERVEVIAEASSKGYPKIRSVRDKATGRWLTLGRVEQVRVGDTIVFKGAGHQRETVTHIDPPKASKFINLEFESGRHFNAPGGTEFYIIEGERKRIAA